MDTSAQTKSVAPAQAPLVAPAQAKPVAWLSAADAAKRFGVSSVTVVRWIKGGYIHGRRKGPGKTSGWVISEDEVLRMEHKLAGSEDTAGDTESFPDLTLNQKET